MNKSDFYKKWYTEEKNQELNAEGYPPVLYKGVEVTTEELWIEYLADEPEVDFLKRRDERAVLLDEPGATYTPPYEWTRNYAGFDEQLDQLYHDIDDGKLGADAKTGTWYQAVKKVKDDTPKN